MENDLLSIYGARLSKNGKYINVSLVSGNGKERKFYTVCVKIDKEAKTHGAIKNGKAIISIPVLEAKKKAEAAAEDYEDDMPF